MLGETVIAVVVGTESVTWNLESGLVAALGFVVAASFWWLYFDYLDGQMLLGRSIWSGQAYIYAHLPLMAGVIALGVGTTYAIKETAGAALAESTRWILGGGIALACGALALIHLAAARSRHDVDVLLRVGVASGALAIALTGGGLGPLPVMTLLTVLVVGSVSVELALHDRHRNEAAPAVPESV